MIRRRRGGRMGRLMGAAIKYWDRIILNGAFPDVSVHVQDHSLGY